MDFAERSAQGGATGVAFTKHPEDIHVLLVDDEKLSRVVVGNLLRKCSYKVTVASSGLEALDVLRRNEPGTFHLILTDVMMPDVDGIELLRHVRSDEAFNSMPVVMMSANEHTDTVFECIRRGAEDYLLKPVTKKEVQYICQHVWRRQKQTSLSVPLLGSDEEEDVESLGVANASGTMPPDPAAHRAANLAHPANSLAQPAANGLANGHARSEPASTSKAPALESLNPTPAALQREAAAAMLAERRRSGDNTSSSRRANGLRPLVRDAAREQVGGGGSAMGGAGQEEALAEQPKLPLSVYFAQRRQVVNSADSFRIFCSVAALLQNKHAKVEVVRVRPSQLCLTARGTVVTAPCSQRAADVEDKLYASPEELLNKPMSAASDIYSLGVLFFELFNPLLSPQERMHTLSGLRHRILPMNLLQGRPQEAAFVLSLLHPDPSARPIAAKIMRPECLAALQKSICKPQSHMDPKNGEDQLDVQVLLDFLRLMYSSKSTEAKEIRSHLQMLDDDIQQVSQRLRTLMAMDRRKSEELSEPVSEAAGSESSRSGSPGLTANSGGSGQGHKREREAQNGVTSSGNSGRNSRKSFEDRRPLEGNFAEGGLEDRVKWTRIAENLPVLENVYLHRREYVTGGPKGLPQLTQPVANGGEAAAEQHMNHLADFSKDLTKLASNTELKVEATLRYGDLMGEGDMVCSAAFDRDDEFFATAGVSKRIKVFELASVLKEESALHYPVLEIGTSSKISSLCWNAYVKTCLLAADYEGAIQLWDVSANSVTAHYEEHLKRVWSVDFSKTDPTRFVSGSDDGTVRLWSMRDSAATATIDSKANVCSVQLSPTNSHLLAFGSANYRVYLYDLRKMKVPLSVIGGHNKAVSYVRFMGGDRLVSASTDNKLKLWDVEQATATGGKCDSLMTYTGHTNERNFVGLSVNPKGYIACGSETNRVFVYYHSLPLPLTSHSFTLPSSRMESEIEGRQFVSTACWSHRGQNLLAANSAGVIKVMSLQ